MTRRVLKRSLWIALALAGPLACPADSQIVFSAQVQVTAQNSFIAPTWGASSQLVYTYKFNRTWNDKLSVSTPFLLETVAVSDAAISISGTGSTVDSVSPNNNTNWTYSLIPPPGPVAEVEFFQLNIPTPVGPLPFCVVAGPGTDPSTMIQVNGADPVYEPTAMVASIYAAFHQAEQNNFGASTEDGFWDAPPPTTSGPWSVSRQYSMDYTASQSQQPCNIFGCPNSAVHISIRYAVSIDVPQPPPQTTGLDDTCQEAGSIIGCQNQSLGQEVPLAGTPFSLHYRSDHQPGSLNPFAAWTIVPPALGGWTLNVNHVWDPVAKVLYLGDGTKRSGGTVNPVPTSDGGFLIPSATGSLIYQFDSKGLHYRTLDEFTGAVVYEFKYDDLSRISSVTDGYGNSTLINRSGAGILAVPTSIFGPYGHITTLGTDILGYLSQLTGPDGATIHMQYDAGGLMQTWLDADGNTHYFGYDLYGRLTVDDDPTGAYQAFVRTDSTGGYTVQRATSSGQYTSYQVNLDANGSGSTGTQFPDGSSSKAAKSGGFYTNVTNSSGMNSSMDYAPDVRWGLQVAAPQHLTMSVPSGLKSQLQLDRTVDLANPSDPLSLVGLHEKLTVNGRTDTNDYDAAQRTFTTVSAGGRKLLKQLDSHGRVVWEQTGNLAPLAYTYDSYGRLSTITAGTGSDARSTLIEYGQDGQPSQVTDPAGRTTQFVCDRAGRLLKTTGPDGQSVAISYDANGNPVSVTPPGRPAHKASYTALDLLASYTPPPVAGADQPSKTTWNDDREVSQVARPDGGVVSQTFDSKGRRASLKFPEGQLTYSYNDLNGAVSQVQDAGGNSVAFTWDGPLLLAETWSGAIAGAVQRIYNSDFRIASLTVPGSDPVAQAYDADGFLVSAGQLTIARDPDNGLVTGATLGQTSDSYAYDEFGEVAQYHADGPPGTLFSAQYTHDQLGRITQTIETVLGTTDTYLYSYDAAGRLVSVAKNGSPAAAYAYDANGNRIHDADASGAQDALFDDQDRLLSRGQTTYTYNANGELTGKNAAGQMSVYQSDSLGSLRRVLPPDGHEIRYLIDGENRRVARMVDGQIVSAYLYQGVVRPIAEFDAAGNLISRFVYGAGSDTPAYMVKGGVTYRIVADPLGSPRLIVDASTGNVIQRIDYDAFGKVLSDSNPGFQPFGFAGGMYDPATGLLRFGARDYDPETGRWTSKDPVGFGSGETNFYVYAQNDPVNRTDTMGLQSSGIKVLANVNKSVGAGQASDLADGAQRVKDAVDVAKAVADNGVAGGMQKIAGDKAKDAVAPGSTEEYRRTTDVGAKVEPKAEDFSDKAKRMWKTVIDACGGTEDTPKTETPKANTNPKLEGATPLDLNQLPKKLSVGRNFSSNNREQ